jgi:exodeoxyribonuclease VII small subunit
MSKQQKFEDAMARLELIVDELESGEIQLDEMLKKYEEGTRLIKFCLEKLEKAEQQIKVLTGDKEKGFNLQDFEE